MDTKPLSPSQGITRGLAGKVQDMLGHGLVKSQVIQSVPTEKLDEFIKTSGANLRDAWVQTMERMLEAFVGCFTVLVDYAAPNAIARAIEEANFDYKYADLDPDKIPLVGVGQAHRKVFEVHFGKTMYNRDLPAALKARGQELGFKLGFKFADPLTALRIACQVPDQQRKYTMAILFEVKGELWFLILSEGADGRRLLVLRGSPDDYWRDDCRVLAVCE